MKKFLIIFVIVITTTISSSALSINIRNDLRIRLNKIHSLHSNFTQTVVDGDGNIIQQGQGDLWIKRPNLFNWHMIQPDESILISDGKTLWFYNPLINQVTASYLRDVIRNTPLILMIRNQYSDWKQYTILKNSDEFILIPKNNTSNFKKLIINISKTGIIRKFSTIEQDDQCTHYILKFQKNSPIDASKFIFIPPKDVTIDDQRINKRMN